ncbi:hypothetical protein [Nocardia sp. XZ_19_385]|uniref:hypothetical protein n=1 Tax=Nocardia sp. XZ_19_385 TaxID=2769488 RepID=UPI00188F99F6|nr:hypothetical protein [Nocardia sp. XZ_19_385]
MGFEELRLPMSGVMLRWRAADGHFRIDHPDHHETDDADESSWRVWSGRGDMAVGVSGEIDGEPDSRWWLVWGEHVGAEVAVRLSDGQRLDVGRFGKLWFAEWRGPEQTARVTAAGRLSEVRFAPPAYVPAPDTENGAVPGDWVHVEAPAAFRAVETKADALLR